MSAIGPKQTSLVSLHMSAFDPKRTFEVSRRANLHHGSVSMAALKGIEERSAAAVANSRSKTAILRRS
jgi:hypothetical protein